MHRTGKEWHSRSRAPLVLWPGPGKVHEPARNVPAVQGRGSPQARRPVQSLDSSPYRISDAQSRTCDGAKEGTYSSQLEVKGFRMKPLSIGEVAKRTGVRTSALRYYEEAGVLPVAARIAGRRRYGADIIHRIDVLRFAQQAGFTLEEIKMLFHGFAAETPLSARWHSLARKKLRELDLLAQRIRRMRRALQLGLKCGCIRIEDCALSPADVSDATGRRAKVGSDRRC